VPRMCVQRPDIWAGVMACSGPPQAGARDRGRTYNPRPVIIDAGASRVGPAGREPGREGRVIASEYLLHRVSTGDSTAIEELIARFGGLVWSLARRIGLPDSETEDAVHEVFTELWRNGNRYDPNIASETAFVATIARRRLIDRRRKIGRQPIRQQLTEFEPTKGGSTPRNEVGEEAARAALAFEQLSPEQQRVLRLSVYEGLSHELISRSTGLPLGTVKTHARRGLIRLREMLNKDKPSDGAAAPATEQPQQTSPPSGEGER